MFIQNRVKLLLSRAVGTPEAVPAPGRHAAGRRYRAGGEVTDQRATPAAHRYRAQQGVGVTDQGRRLLGRVVLRGAGLVRSCLTTLAAPGGVVNGEPRHRASKSLSDAANGGPASAYGTYLDRFWCNCRCA